MQFPEGIAEALFVYNKMTRKFPTTVFREDGPELMIWRWVLEVCPQ